MPTLTILHGCRTLQLSRGFNTLIDEDDFESVGQFRWAAAPCTLGYYVKRQEHANRKGKWLRLHRVIMNARPGTEIDHRNGDTFDNRKKNLRVATKSQNQQNRHRILGRSKYKGVNRSRYSWRAYIKVNRRFIHLGGFATEEEAARAYDLAAKFHFGEFARTNESIYGSY